MKTTARRREWGDGLYAFGARKVVSKSFALNRGMGSGEFCSGLAVFRVHGIAQEVMGLDVGVALVF